MTSAGKFQSPESLYQKPTMQASSPSRVGSASSASTACPQSGLGSSLYAPGCVEVAFCDLRPNGVLRSSPVGGAEKTAHG
jgi:hypothetical protein